MTSTPEDIDVSHMLDTIKTAETKQNLSDDLWKKNHEAHLIHHRIADFILHKDERENPVGLRHLVKKYEKMRDEADDFKKQNNL